MGVECLVGWQSEGPRGCQPRNPQGGCACVRSVWACTLLGHYWERAPSNRSIWMDISQQFAGWTSGCWSWTLISRLSGWLRAATLWSWVRLLCPSTGSGSFHTPRSSNRIRTRSLRPVNFSVVTSLCELHLARWSVFTRSSGTLLRTIPQKTSL